MVARRTLFEAAGLAALAALAADGQEPDSAHLSNVELADVPLASGSTITVERRGQIVLIGLNRPSIQNRLDPATRVKLAGTYYQFEHDASLRAAVLFGHGDNFSRGIDVDASQSSIQAGRPAVAQAQTPVLDPLGKAKGHLTKPVVAVVHGDTWNLGHEIYLSADIRVAAANTRFGQDENTHGRFPGGGATVRFVREAGWGNAMRYMLTGDHWTAEESRRMGVTQEIATTQEAALQLGIEIANRIAACGPLGIRATLASAHQVIDPVEADALSKLDAQYGALYRTEDFVEGRKAEAEGRPPVYRGK